MFIVVGLLFFVFERLAKRQKDIQLMSLFDSLVIGLAQILSLVPGVSRSGITIIAGLGRRLKREEAAKFSFLLSAAITGYLTIKYLLKYLAHHSLNIFAWYRLIIGSLILIWFFFFLAGA